MTPHASSVGPFPDGVDADEYDRRRRRLLWRLTSGLYLVGSHFESRRNLMTANLVSQVSTEPKLLGVAIEKDSLTLELISSSKAFSLCLLRRDDRALVRKFVKAPEEDRTTMTIGGSRYFDAPVTGSPVLGDAFGYLDLRLHQSVALGSHIQVIGEVVDAVFLKDEDEEVLRMEDTKMNYGG